MKLKELIESGTRNLANWHTVRDGDNITLAADDCDGQRTVAIDATEISGKLADDLYREIVGEADDGEYSETRDANRFSIWEIGYDKKDGYRLYIMIDGESCDYVFLASGNSSQCIYRTDEDMLAGFYGIA